MFNKTIGGIFILTGSAIGAGMLALPLVGASAGFFYSTILLILNWLLMTLTALLTLEATLAFKPYNNSFGTMTQKILGRPGQIITWFSYLLLLYATTAAYICGSTSLLDVILKNTIHIQLPFWVSTTLFTLFFGGIVFLGTSIVDYSIRFLLSAKAILLMVALVVLVPYVDSSKLLNQSFSAQYLWVAAPIFLNAFGFHFAIPSVSSYCDQHAKNMRRVIIASTTIPLLIYILWLLVTFGIIPITGKLSFATIAYENTSVGGLIQTLNSITKNKYTASCINIFSNIAMTTSFLGVALGLFDFLADGFKRTNTHTGRLQTAILTFLPPILFALFYQNGFIMALEYSAFFAIILEVFLPTLLVYRLRSNNKLQSTYRVPLNRHFLLILLFGIGSLLMLTVIAKRLNLLPLS
ncbi:Tyrosine-specific transport protein [Gammaproteobacteria bacterium]